MHQGPTDGRALRSERTRARIVDATIALVENGDLRPTGPRIATRAGVSVRSVYQHFDDLESLHSAVFQRMLERVVHLLVPVDPALALPERLERFVHRRGQLHEAVTPVRRAAEVHGPFSAVISGRLGASRSFLRAEVEAAFGAELDDAGADRAELLDALEAALSWATWDGLRRDRGLGVDAAEAVTRRLTRALLSHADRPVEV